MDEQEFHRRAEQALESLKRSLYVAEEQGDFEVEEAGGALQILFEEPPGKFVVSPNGSMRQIWISALATSYKLDWSPEAAEFVLPKTGEKLKTLLARLINEQLQSDKVRLD